MESFRFNYDFSLLSAIELQREKINHRKIISVYENVYSVARSIEGLPLSENYYFLIGFGSKKRFLLIALKIQEGNVVFLQVEVADEQDIRRSYCGRSD